MAANAQEEEDDFIGAGLFSSLKPREVQKMKKESSSDKKLAADLERLEKDAKDLFCQTAEAIAAKKPCPPAEDPLDLGCSTLEVQSWPLSPATSW